MPTTRNIALILALAATALTPAAALASGNGADDNPGAPDHHGAVVTAPAVGPADDNPATHESRGATAPAGGAADDNTRAHDRRGGAAAHGRHGGRITGAGTCTAASTAALKVKRDNRRLETAFEVDQNRSGVTWTVEIDVNGNPVVKTTATTGGRSGSFSLERRLADGAGSDSITATATSPSGEVCSAAVTV